MKRAVTALAALTVFLIATGSAAAGWRDAGTQKAEGFRSVHVFENVSDDGKVISRIFVPEQVELGGILATKILYVKTTTGQDVAIVWRLDVVGIAPNGVELWLLNGEASQNVWNLLKNDPLRHWAIPIEQEREERDVRLTYSVDARTMRLLVSGLEVMIAVHPQDSSYLTTEAWLVQ